MYQLAAFILVRDHSGDWYFVPVLCGIALVVLSTKYWRLVPQWFRGLRGRNWPTVEAVVDITSVTPYVRQGRSAEYIAGYLATLTYFYRNPDLQTGDYQQLFETEEEATAWADSYKGSTVMPHVDPHDPSRSILRRKD